jgi:branched-chain amino acid transport system substrate-binding protein
MTITRLITSSAVAAMVTLAIPSAAGAQEREVKLTGFGAMSGVVRSFGINSRAALEAAADEVNKGGGVKLGDGTKGKLVIDYFDDRCNAEEGISVTRRMASSPTLVGIGPTCSNVAEPLFGILQKKVGDAGDSGLQFPVFTDVAIKGIDRRAFVLCRPVGAWEGLSWALRPRAVPWAGVGRPFGTAK